jgi:hypoxanthine phosphoribosyltransferase
MTHPSQPQPPAADIRPLITAEQLACRVAELARQISADYAGQRPLVVGVLKGAWVFLADLVRLLTIPADIDFIKISSYGTGTSTTGEVRLQLDLLMPAAGRHVLLVEDIVDTGLCCRWLLDHIRSKGAASARFCTLLDNPARRTVPVTLDYVGFPIPNRFVVGYGIDWNECYRQLPYIGYLAGGGEP